VWRLAPDQPDGWFRLQTNYDHWQPVPAADDRRTPGVASMRAIGQAGLGTASLWGAITRFPVFNHHTDYSGVYVPARAMYNSSVWMGA
jgi:hypothetical protein